MSRTVPFAVVLLGLLSIAATRLVAMRVEAETISPSEPESTVQLTVQVAPEDRTRVGGEIWLKVELRQGERTIDHFDLGAALDASGATTLTRTWPPGQYELRVDIEGVAGQGFWIGPITVTGPVPAGATGEQPPAAPTPLATPTVAAPPEPANLEPALKPEPARAAPPATPEPPPSTPTAATVPVEPIVTAPVTPQPAPIPAAEATPPDQEPAPPISALDPDQAELTVLVTAGARPATDASRARFQLEIDGDPVAVAGVGGSGDTPLSLALAIDLSASMAAHLDEVRRLLPRLVFKASSGRGRFSVISMDSEVQTVLDWSGSAAQLSDALENVRTASEGDLAGLVTTALDRLADRHGRRCLVLITDGGDLASKAAWREAQAAAEATGAPVLVIAFDGELRSRTRTRLQRLATASGGDAYFLRDTETLGSVIDFYGGLLDASYSLRFARPASSGEQHRVRIEAGAYDVRYPRTFVVQQ